MCVSVRDSSEARLVIRSIEAQRALLEHTPKRKRNTSKPKDLATNERDCRRGPC